MKVILRPACSKPDQNNLYGTQMDIILHTSQNLCTESPRLCLATEPSTLVESVSDLLFLFFWFTACSPLRLILSALLAPTQDLERPSGRGGHGGNLEQYIIGK